jgi:hypothetical protein
VQKGVESVEIDIAGPMVAAQRGDVGTYQPVVDGKKLALESGSVQATLSNLNRLTDTSTKKLQRQVVSIYALNGRILVVFDTGESYLATGFSLGSDERETSELALFAVKHKLGRSKRDCMSLCRTLSPNHTGLVFPLPPAPISKTDEDSAIISTGDTQTLPIRQ